MAISFSLKKYYGETDKIFVKSGGIYGALSIGFLTVCIMEIGV